MQVALGLYVVSKLGGLFTVMGWTYTVLLLSFTIPKIYELKKHEIDTAAQTGFQKVSDPVPFS